MRGNLNRKKKKSNQNKKQQLLDYKVSWVSFYWLWNKVPYLCVINCERGQPL